MGNDGGTITWWTWFVFRVSDLLQRDPELEVPKGQGHNDGNFSILCSVTVTNAMTKAS